MCTVHLASLRSIQTHFQHSHTPKGGDSIFRTDCTNLWLVDSNLTVKLATFYIVDATNSWLDRISVVETLPNPSYDRIDLLEASDLEQNRLKVAGFFTLVSTLP